MAPSNSTCASASKRVAVIGVGFVGQHLVDVFSRRHHVTGFDVSAPRVAALQQHYAGNANVTIQSTTDGLSEADLFCISVPTLLLADNRGVDTSYVQKAVATVAAHARPGAVVVMESSVSVGMTRQLLSGLRSKGIFVGFSPERVDPGRTYPEAWDIEKVVAGIDEPSLGAVVGLYSSVYSRVVPVSSLETAEMCKLYENCFRMINIAYVNEVADQCAQFGIDPQELVSAAATKPYGFMPFWPGAGVGGHCIPVNPSFLFVNCDLPLLKAATEATHARPTRLAQHLATEHSTAQRWLVVGAAFKPGEVLITYSPGAALASELARLGKQVHMHDPLVRDAGTAPSHTFIGDADWSAEHLDSAYNVVVVANQQLGVDMGVLRQLRSAQVVSYVRIPGLCKEAQVVEGGIKAPASPQACWSEGKDEQILVNAIGSEPGDEMQSEGSDATDESMQQLDGMAAQKASMMAQIVQAGLLRNTQ